MSEKPIVLPNEPPPFFIDLVNKIKERKKISRQEAQKLASQSKEWEEYQRQPEYKELKNTVQMNTKMCG